MTLAFRFLGLLGPAAWLACTGASPHPGAGASEDGARKAGGRAERRVEIERQIQLLRSELWCEREAATERLKGFGAEILPHLSGRESDADPEFALRVRALIRHAHLAVPGLSGSVGALMRDYAAQPPAQRAEIVQSVVRAANAACVPLLLNLLDAEEERVVQEAILSQLGWLNTGLDGLKPLLKFYARCPEGLKSQVLWALAGIPCEGSRKAVREALAGDAGPEAETSEVRSAAIRAAVRLGDRESLPALRRLAGDNQGAAEALRVQALAALVALFDTEAGEIFRQALSGSQALQSAALKGLAGLRDRRCAPLLCELLNDETKKELREEVVDAMGAVGDPSFAALLEACLKKEPPGLRISALTALYLMDAKSSAAAAAGCLDDPDHDVRQAAAHVVAGLGYREAIPKLKFLMNDRDRTTAFQAARALANLGAPEGAERIVDTARALLQGLEEGGDLVRTSEEAVGLIGKWQIEAGRPVLESLAPALDENVLSALFEFSFDGQAFHALLEQRLAQHLAAPENAQAAFDLALLYRERGLYDRALALQERLARRAPNQAAILDRLATTCHEAGRYEESEAAYDRLEALSGTNATYLNNRAWFYCTAFAKEFLRPNKALELVRRSVAMEPRSTYIVDTLGWALYTCGQHEEAVRELRRALELKDGADRPGRAWERTRIARPLWAAGRREEALAETAQALAAAPSDPKVWVEAAGFYAQAGHRDEAVNALHVSLDLGWIQGATLELNPEFASLRQDPGYTSALRRVRQAREAVERIVVETEAKVLKALGERGLLEGAEAPPDFSDGELFYTPDD